MFSYGRDKSEGSKIVRELIAMDVSVYRIHKSLIFFTAVLIITLHFISPVLSENSVEEIDFNRIADAIYLAEGGMKARKPYGILSVPCNGYDECRRICINTIRNNFRRWREGGSNGDYLAFLASRYAPLNASNDPHGLNNNWLKNVRYFMEVSK